MATRAKREDLEHRSFRLPRQLLDAIRRRAELNGTSQTALVERYLDEGLRMEAHPMIVYRSSPLGRRAMLAGTRLDVSQVIATIREEDGSLAAAAEYFALGLHHVQACTQYYAEHQAEVDAYSARAEAEGERLREAFEHEQALLAG